MKNKMRMITVTIHVPPASATREARMKAYGVALALLDGLFDIDGSREKAWAAQVDTAFQRFLRNAIGETKTRAPGLHWLSE